MLKIGANSLRAELGVGDGECVGVRACAANNGDFAGVFGDTGAAAEAEAAVDWDSEAGCGCDCE